MSEREVLLCPRGSELPSTVKRPPCVAKIGFLGTTISNCSADSLVAEATVLVEVASVQLPITMLLFS